MFSGRRGSRRRTKTLAFLEHDDFDEEAEASAELYNSQLGPGTCTAEELAASKEAREKSVAAIEAQVARPVETSKSPSRKPRTAKERRARAAKAEEEERLRRLFKYGDAEYYTDYETEGEYDLLGSDSQRDQVSTERELKVANQQAVEKSVEDDFEDSVEEDLEDSIEGDLENSVGFEDNLPLSELETEEGQKLWKKLTSRNQQPSQPQPSLLLAEMPPRNSRKRGVTEPALDSTSGPPAKKTKISKYEDFDFWNDKIEGAPGTNDLSRKLQATALDYVKRTVHWKIEGGVRKFELSDQSCWKSIKHAKKTGYLPKPEEIVAVAWIEATIRPAKEWQTSPDVWPWVKERYEALCQGKEMPESAPEVEPEVETEVQPEGGEASTAKGKGKADGNPPVEGHNQSQPPELGEIWTTVSEHRTDIDGLDARMVRLEKLYTLLQQGADVSTGRIDESTRRIDESTRRINELERRDSSRTEKEVRLREAKASFDKAQAVLQNAQREYQAAQNALQQ